MVGNGRNEAEKKRRRRKRRRVLDGAGNPEMGKIRTMGGGHEGFTAPSPQAQHRPPGSAAEQWTVSGWSVDNAMNASELRSRCPDFPAPSSWCQMPSGPSFAGKPALQLLATGDIQTPTPPRDSHDARTHNSDNTTVPTATRRDFSSFLSRTIFPLPNFLSRKKQVSKNPVR